MRISRQEGNFISQRERKIFHKNSYNINIENSSLTFESEFEKKRTSSEL
jgi:hypothetical protein